MTSYTPEAKHCRFQPSVPLTDDNPVTKNGRPCRNMAVAARQRRESDGSVVKPYFHLAWGVCTESGVHLLYPTATLQEGVDISLQLGPDTCPAGNGMVIITVAGPVTGLLQIAFVEFTHGLFSINENRTTSTAGSMPGSTPSRPPAACGPVLASL